MSSLFGVSINELLSGHRLDDTAYKQAAEKNLTDIIHAGTFSYREKIVYYKTKWKKEHRGRIWSMYILLSGLLIAGILTKPRVLTAAAAVLFPIGYAWLHNSMMVYVEQRAFDGSGSEKENS